MFDSDLQVTDVHPKRIPDIFKGEQVIVFGSYAGDGPKQIRISGYVRGQKHTFTYDVDFPEFSDDDHHAFVPRLSCR